MCVGIEIVLFLQVRFIEKKKYVPRKADGNILAAALFLFLYKLPQPILT